MVLWLAGNACPDQGARGRRVYAWRVAAGEIHPTPGISILLLSVFFVTTIVLLDSVYKA